MRGTGREGTGTGGAGYTDVEAASFARVRAQAQLTAGVRMEFMSDVALSEKEIRLRETCTDDLRTFARTFFPTIDRHAYVDGWHIGAIAETLTAIELGQIRLLLINMPPRHMKSMLLSVMYPAWVWIKKPWEKWMFGSYSADLSLELAGKSRDVIVSDLYRKFFGHIYQLRVRSNSLKRYRTTEGGTRYSTSVGAGATGMGGDKVVIDDAHATNQAESDKVRQATVDWYVDTMFSRVESQKTGVRIVCGQRVHLRDVSAAIIDHGTYHVLTMPAEFRSKTVCEITLPAAPTVDATPLKVGDSIRPVGEKHHRKITRRGKYQGEYLYQLEDSVYWWTILGERRLWRDPRTDHGEVLWPGSSDKAELELQRQQRPRTYETQFQQNPMAPEGAMFRVADWKKIRPEEAPEDIKWVRFWDLAGTKVEAGKKPDWTAGAKVGKSPSTKRRYLGHIARTQSAPADVIKLMKRMAARDGHMVPIYVEQEGGSHTKFALEYIAEQLDGYSVKAIPTGGSSKRERAQPVADKAALGFWSIFDDAALPEDEKWNRVFLEELESFPEGEHDDMCDGVSGGSAEIDKQERKGVMQWSDDHHTLRTVEATTFFGDDSLAPDGRWVPPKRFHVICGIRYDEIRRSGGMMVYVAVPPDGHKLADSIIPFREVPLEPGLAPMEIVARCRRIEGPQGKLYRGFADQVMATVVNPDNVKLQEVLAMDHGRVVDVWDRDPRAGLGLLRDQATIDELRPHPIFVGVMGRPRMFVIAADAQVKTPSNADGMLALRRDMGLFALDDRKTPNQLDEYPALAALLGAASFWWGSQAEKTDAELRDERLPDGLRPGTEVELTPGYNRHIARDMFRAEIENADDDDGETDLALVRRKFGG